MIPGFTVKWLVVGLPEGSSKPEFWPSLASYHAKQKSMQISNVKMGLFFKKKIPMLKMPLGGVFWLWSILKQHIKKSRLAHK